MKNTDYLHAAIKNNRTALLLGPAGTAKTATVHKIALEHKMPVVTLLLAGILPEDIGGLVRATEDGNGYRYLAPQWFLENQNKPFVLFLDEINQANIQTLHACFYIVNDRQVAGLKNPEMRVIAAGNCEDQNEFLTPMPTPLLDRFVYKIKWKADVADAIEYLSKKYSKDKRALILLDCVKRTYTQHVTPRHIEQMIWIIQDGTDNHSTGSELVGPAYEAYLKKLAVGQRHIEDNRMAELRDIAEKIKNPNSFIIKGGLAVRPDINELVKGLTPEELELIHAA